MNALVRNIKIWLAYLASLLIPRGKYFMFTSSPDYDDNPYALYKYMLKTNIFAKYKFVWLLHDDKDGEKRARVLRDNAEVIIPSSGISEWWYVFRARMVFYSHSFYNDYRFAQSDKRINLWHGTPLKKVGIDNGEEIIRTDRLLTINSTWQSYLAHSFCLKKEQVWVTGTPRNDMMFEPTTFFAVHGINREQYKSVGIWLPTFRKHRLENRQDGEYEVNRLAGFSFDDLRETDRFLVEQQALLIVKLHMYDSLQDTVFPKFKNLLIIKADELKVPLYPLLGATDYLITDYSSVMFDYDILQHPMGFVVKDLEAYQNNRGFYGDQDNLEEILPGKIIKTTDELKDFIANYKSYYIDTHNRFNEYKDSSACERVANQVKQMADEC